MAPARSSSTKKKAGPYKISQGFGKKQVVAKKVSVGVLLERSENRYIELEKKCHIEDSQMSWREYVIAAKSQEVNQLRDWVPFACAGIATTMSTEEAMPLVLFSECRRELLEGLRQVLGGNARRQISSAPLEWSYEPLEDWNKRVLETLETNTADRMTEISTAADVLGLGNSHQADVSEIKAAFRAQARKVHPDTQEFDNSTDEPSPSLSDLKTAHDLLVDQARMSETKSRQPVSGTYETIGGSGLNKFSSFSGPLSFSQLDSTSAHNDTKEEKEVSPLEAAISRLDPDLVTPFLFRNNRS